MRLDKLSASAAEAFQAAMGVAGDNDASIIASRYLGVGGISLLLTHWLTQFFIFRFP